MSKLDKLITESFDAEREIEPLLERVTKLLPQPEALYQAMTFPPTRGWEMTPREAFGNMTNGKKPIVYGYAISFVQERIPDCDEEFNYMVIEKLPPVAKDDRPDQHPGEGVVYHTPRTQLIAEMYKWNEENNTDGKLRHFTNGILLGYPPKDVLSFCRRYRWKGSKI